MREIAGKYKKGNLNRTVQRRTEQQQGFVLIV